MIATSLSLVINSPGATALTAVPVAPWTLSGNALSYPATSPLPVPAGSPICALSVTPSTWSGVLTLSGANASSFALSGMTLNVGANPLPPETLAVTITATP
jgi:hypothetical protein